MPQLLYIDDQTVKNNLHSNHLKNRINHLKNRIKVTYCSKSLFCGMNKDSQLSSMYNISLESNVEALGSAEAIVATSRKGSSLGLTTKNDDVENNCVTHR